MGLTETIEMQSVIDGILVIISIIVNTLLNIDTLLRFFSHQILAYLSQIRKSDYLYLSIIYFCIFTSALVYLISEIHFDCLINAM